MSTTRTIEHLPLEALRADPRNPKAAKALLIERLIALRDHTPEEGQSPAEQVHQIVSGTVIPEQEQEEGEDA